jgi:hypothetical protein
MHVQLKTPDGPPDNLCAKIGGLLVHDDFKAKLRNGRWIYESSRHTDNSLAIPAWIDRSTVTMSVHDEEAYVNGVAHIVCATSGRPLVPYYVPVQHATGSPDACFSLSFPFVHIAYLKSINYLWIRHVNPVMLGDEATAMTDDVFRGPVAVRTAYCKNCDQEFDARYPHDLDHHIVVSTFDVPQELDYLRSAILAATRKAWGPKPSRAYYVHKPERRTLCNT